MLSNVQSLVVFIGLFLMMGYGIYRTTVQRKLPYIRRLAPIEAIDEGIGRAVEEGRKVHCGLPLAQLTGGRVAETLTGISIMGHFAEKAAKAGVPAFYTVNEPAALTIIEGVVRDAYMAAGKLDDFNNPDVCQVRLFHGTYAFAQAAMYLRENIGFTVISGFIGKELLFVGESSRIANAFSILAYPSIEKLEWAIPTFDYVLMLQETYVAGAFLTQDPTRLGTVIGTDIASWTGIIAIVVFTVIATLLGTSLTNILVG